MSNEWIATRIPPDHETSPGKDAAYSTCDCILDQHLSGKVLKVARRTHLNTYAILLSGLFALLRKYLGADHLMIGAPAFDNDKSLPAALVPLRLDWQPGAAFKDLVAHVKQLVRESRTQHQQAVPPSQAFPILFVFEALQELEQAYAAQPEIIFSFRLEEHSILLAIHYNSHLFDAGKMEGMGRHFSYLLRQCLEKSDTGLQGFELLDISELPPAMPPTGKQQRHTSVIEVFAAQAARNPDNIALVFQEEEITYRELNRRANALAGSILPRVSGNNGIVGILLERSVDMIVAILGILKTGAGYLPLDPSLPADRLEYMLADSGCNLVITGKGIQHTLGSAIAIHFIDQPPAGLEVAEICRETAPEDLLYIIYTSGTTGKPKGAVIENRNLLALLFAEPAPFTFGPADTWVLFHSYCFDFSVWEIFGALLFGGKLVIMSDIAVRSPGTLLKVLQDQRVTVLNQTPSAFYNLVLEASRSWPALPGLHTVIFGGEALSPVKLKSWFAHYPQVRLINMYGITETTIHVTFREIAAYDIAHNHSNIGRPLPHLSVRLLNKDGNVLPPGFTGEIVVAGHSVCRGYLNKPALTARKFRVTAAERSYLSGDLARFNQQQELVYLGRKDTQVQLRGYRIELGEIEAALLQYPGIVNAVVLCRESGEEEQCLCAYYVAAGKRDHKDVRLFLSRTLPVYMIPSYFIFIAQLPLNHNGKIDVARLPGIPTSTQAALPPAPLNVDGDMLNIWRHNLGMSEVPANESYFSIGGDSMKALRLLNLINDRYRLRLALKDIYRYNTLEQISAFVQEQKKDASLEVRAVIEQELSALKAAVLEKEEDADNIEDVYPMADIQRGMAFYAGMDLGAPFYHDQMVHTLHYPGFDYATFLEAVKIMCSRHPILRTAFRITGYNEPLQVVYKSCPADVESIAITAATAAEETAFIRHYLEKDRLQPLDISQAPIWRIRVFPLNRDTVTFVFVFHHAIMDGWSDAAFKTELHNIYLDMKSGRPAGMLPLQSSYKDFVIEEMISKRDERARAFWKHELAAYQRLVINGRHAAPKQVLASCHTVFPAQLLNDIRQCCASQQISVKTLFFTAYALLLSAAGKAGSFVVGYCTHNRPVAQDSDRLLGCFLNVIPVKVEIAAGTPWLQLARQMEQQLSRLKEYDRLPLTEILAAAGRDTIGNNPLFDVLFNYVDFHVYSQMGTAVSIVEDAGSNNGYTNTNTLLDFNISNTQDVFELVVNYAGNVFEEQEVKIMSVYYRRILERLVAPTSSVTVAPVEDAGHSLISSISLAGAYENAAGPGKQAVLDISEQLQADVLALALDNQVRPEALLLTAYKVLLYKYTFRKNAPLGYRVPAAGRQPDVQELLAAFNNILPVSLCLDTGKDLMFNCRAANSWLEVCRHPATTFNELVDLLFEQQAMPADEQLEAVFALDHETVGMEGKLVLSVTGDKDRWHVKFIFPPALPEYITEELPAAYLDMIALAAREGHRIIDQLPLFEDAGKQAFTSSDILKPFNF